MKSAILKRRWDALGNTSDLHKAVWDAIVASPKLLNLEKLEYDKKDFDLIRVINEEVAGNISLDMVQKGCGNFIRTDHFVIPIDRFEIDVYSFNRSYYSIGMRTILFSPNLPLVEVAGKYFLLNADEGKNGVFDKIFVYEVGNGNGNIIHSISLNN